MYEGPVQDLIDELGRLPGIGPKSAQRLAFHILKVETVDAERLARAITEVKARVHFCRVCWNVAEGDLCRICKDPRRDPSLVCVVEEPRDLVAIERTQEFRGRYHVLQGAISPIEGIGPWRSGLDSTRPPHRRARPGRRSSWFSPRPRGGPPGPGRGSARRRTRGRRPPAGRWRSG